LRDARSLGSRDEVTNARLTNDEDASRPFTAKKTEKKKRRLADKYVRYSGACVHAHAPITDNRDARSIDTRSIQARVQDFSLETTKTRRKKKKKKKTTTTTTTTTTTKKKKKKTFLTAVPVGVAVTATGHRFLRLYREEFKA